MKTSRYGCQCRICRRRRLMNALAMIVVWGCGAIGAVGAGTIFVLLAWALLITMK